MLKAQDKLAKTALKSMDASSRAFENFNKACRELEIKYGKRDLQKTSNFVQQNQQINVHQTGNLNRGSTTSVEVTESKSRSEVPIAKLPV